MQRFVVTTRSRKKLLVLDRTYPFSLCTYPVPIHSTKSISVVFRMSENFISKVLYVHNLHITNCKHEMSEHPKSINFSTNGRPAMHLRSVECTILTFHWIGVYCKFGSAICNLRHFGIYFRLFSLVTPRFTSTLRVMDSCDHLLIYWLTKIRV